MSLGSDLRLGVDVGGTHTDAVLIDQSGGLVAKAKRATTRDIATGIDWAIAAVLERATVSPKRITHAMVGSTHASNALLERKGLARTAVVRLGSPATASLAPLETWPTDLRDAVGAASTVIEGGFQLDGREISPLDTDALRRFLEGLDSDVDAVAITSVFASVSDAHELDAQRVVHEVLGDVSVSLSHEIGTIGLIERENATVLNAALAGPAREVALALDRVLESYDVSPKVYFTQNDGTLMGLDFALGHAVLTIASGPANSMRGAAYLSRAEHAVVVDVGGTSTDVGLLANGHPCDSPIGSEVAGVVTNFRTPLLVSLPIGGGTPVRRKGRAVTLGATSIGHRVQVEALVFGGATPTLTDAVVESGRATFGERPLAAKAETILAPALAEAERRVVAAVDSVQRSPGGLPLVAVGGLAALVPDELPGISSVERPEHHEVANAIGAAIASAGGECERIVAWTRRERGLEDTIEGAFQSAVRAGADPARIEVVEVEEVPVSYLVDPAVRIRVKAAGPIATT